MNLKNHFQDNFIQQNFQMSKFVFGEIELGFEMANLFIEKNDCSYFAFTYFEKYKKRNLDRWENGWWTTLSDEKNAIYLIFIYNDWKYCFYV